MSIDKEKKSNRLLASRRYTHDSFTDAQESFTNVLDLQASEIYTQASKIPSSNLPFSGSSQNGSFYTDGDDNILRYYHKHKLTKSNLNNEVWFFLNPTGSASGIGAQLIDDNQQTNFISPKYSVSTLANATTEDDTPGYLAKVFISNSANSASVSDSDAVSVNNYQFDYKTGVLQFINSSVDPTNSQYVYISVYQYVGKTLEEGIELTGDISGSSASTGSFGHLIVAGNITASGVVRADAFESVTGGETIDFKDSVNITGNITADNLTADSSSISIRLSDVEAGSTSKTLVSGSAQIASDISGSFVEVSSSISIRLSDVEAGSTSKTLVSGSAQIASDISGSFTSTSASISIRLSDVEAGSTSKTLVSGSAQISDDISGSFTAPSASFSTRITNLVSDSSSFSNRITIAENELENTIFSASAQLSEEISGSFTAPSASFSTRITNLKIDSGSISIRLSDVEAGSTSKTLVSESAQIASDISGSFVAPSSSFSTRITNLKTDSGSFSTRITSDSSSISTRLTTEEINIDALQIDSASFSLRLTQATASIAQITQSIVELKQDSASLSTRMDAESGSFALRITQATASIFEITQSVVKLKEDSGSFSDRATESTASIFALKQDSASLSTRIDTESGSFALRITQATASISEITQSIVELKQDSASFSSRATESTSSIFALKEDSASFSSRATESTSSIFALKQDSASFSDRATESTASIFALKQDSASLSTRIDTESGSFALRITQATASIAEITQSIVELKEDSGSFSSRTTFLEGSGEIQSLGTTNNVLFSSITASDDVKFNGDLVVEGKVTAQEFHTEIVSSSIVFTSGSTKFGDSIDDNHSITGSINQSGSLNINDGDLTIKDNLEVNGNISGSVTSTGSFGRVEVAGDSSFTGNVIIGGNIQIGDTDSDSLTISADLTSNLVPNVDSTFDIGSDSKNWRRGYIEKLEITNITASGDISGSETSSGSLGHFHVDNKIGIGVKSPKNSLHINATDGIIIPVGTTAQRTSDAVAGEIRFNSQQNTYEGYDGNNWGTLGGVVDVDQDTKISAENSAGDDNDQLRFFTAGSERLRIFADGHISASNDITASKNVRIDGDLIVSNLSNSNISQFSSSLSENITRATASIREITQSIVELKQDSASLSTRIDTESGSFALRITQATASIFELTQSVVELKQDSSSFSDRATESTASIFALKQDSASFSDRIDTESGSFALRITQATASIQELTQSIFELKQDSGSLSTRLDTESGSFALRITQATSSIAELTQSVVELKQDSGSFSTRITNLKSDSGSFSLQMTQATASIAEITQSIVKLKEDSGSFSLRTTTLEGTGTIQGLGTTNNVLFNSITASDDVRFEGDLVVDGTVTAQEFHTEIVSSSIIFTSGSTKFGDTIDDNHLFTGSLFISGNLTAVNLVADSASVSDRLTESTSSINALKIDSGSFSDRITSATASINLLKVDSGSFSTRITQATSSIREITQSIVELKEDSGSFSLRITQATASIQEITRSIVELKEDSGSFSLRNTNLETTSSALINNFDQVQSLGKTDSVVFSNITASNDVSVNGKSTLAGNVLMQNELNVLGNITSSGNIFANGDISQSLSSTGSFGMIKKDGLDIREHFSRNTVEAFELDENGDFIPTEPGQYMIDPRWELDEDGNIQRRERELWTFNWDDYFSD